MPEELVRLKNLIGELQEKELLSKHSTFRIGGTAKFFYLVKNKEELMPIIAVAKKIKMPYFILGGGSNVLFSDKGFDGIILKIAFDKVKVKNQIMECEAGVALSRAMGTSVASSLSGLEWAAGIPGTVGGAIWGNAGAYGHDISESIESVTVLRNNKLKIIPKKNLKFSYRFSSFQNSDDIIISASFKLVKADMNESQIKMRDLLKERSKKFESYASVGSIFKNVDLTVEESVIFLNKFPQTPPEFIKNRKIPAAWLIDQCGLKGKTIGGAKISENHAGVIVNTGSATAENVIMLISIIKQKIRSNFGLQLMEEVQYVGFN